jgi:hypothetical protein
MSRLFTVVCLFAVSLTASGVTGEPDATIDHPKKVEVAPDSAAQVVAHPAVGRLEGGTSKLGDRTHPFQFWLTGRKGDTVTGFVSFPLGLRTVGFRLEGSIDAEGRVVMTAQEPQQGAVHPHSPVLGMRKLEGAQQGGVFKGFAYLFLRDAGYGQCLIASDGIPCPFEFKVLMPARQKAGE